MNLAHNYFRVVKLNLLSLFGNTLNGVSADCQHRGIQIQTRDEKAFQGVRLRTTAAYFSIITIWKPAIALARFQV